MMLEWEFNLTCDLLGVSIYKPITQVEGRRVSRVEQEVHELVRGRLLEKAQLVHAGRDERRAYHQDHPGTRACGRLRAC